MSSRYKADDLIMNTVYGYKLFLNLDELEHANDMYFHKIIITVCDFSYVSYGCNFSKYSYLLFYKDFA